MLQAVFAVALVLDSMTLHVSVPRQVRAGEPVHVALSVTNRILAVGIRPSALPPVDLSPRTARLTRAVVKRRLERCPNRPGSLTLIAIMALFQVLTDGTLMLGGGPAAHRSIGPDHVLRGRARRSGPWSIASPS